MSKKLKKIKKEMKIKDSPVNYIVVSSCNNHNGGYLWPFLEQTEVKYFTDLLDVGRYIKTLSYKEGTRVFKVEEELKLKSRVELEF